MENSGGLLVHKATHHFDMVNWWIDDEPETVYAFGDLKYYGLTRENRGERCSTCAYTESCEFYVNYASNAKLKALYFDAESADGYYRDRCVFADEIDIYDTMSVAARYKSGITLSYSLIAHSPYEAWRAAVNGTEGRLELEEYHSGDRTSEPVQYVHLFNRRGERVTYQISKAGGGHGGGDARLLERLFSGKDMPDPLVHMADSRAGAMSVLLGVAANRSIATGKPVTIDELLRS
jgi:predicted dehydrogenase